MTRSTHPTAVEDHDGIRKMPKLTLYFAYGSNLHLSQMSRRCPGSTYAGIARLCDWRWIINECGYATVVPTKSGDKQEHVWGMAYTLTPEDEKALDGYEGVPISYTKHYLSAEFWPTDTGVDSVAHVEKVKKEPEMLVEMLVYVDGVRVTESEPKEEYVYRMNAAIKDALGAGIPRKYIDDTLRRFIREAEDGIAS